MKKKDFMKKLLYFMKDYKKESVLAPLFKMLEAFFELFVPLVVASIIDDGIVPKDSEHIIRMCLLLLVLAAVGLTCSITAQYFAAKSAVGAATGIRYELFTHIQTLGYEEMDMVGTSTLITRMTSDINQVQNGINLVLRLFLRSPFIVFGAMIMAFTIDVKAAMILLWQSFYCLSLYLVSCLLQSHFIKRYSQDSIRFLEQQERILQVCV